MATGLEGRLVRLEARLEGLEKRVARLEDRVDSLERSFEELAEEPRLVRLVARAARRVLEACWGRR